MQRGRPSMFLNSSSRDSTCESITLMTAERTGVGVQERGMKRKGPYGEVRGEEVSSEEGPRRQERVVTVTPHRASGGWNRRRMCVAPMGLVWVREVSEWRWALRTQPTQASGAASTAPWATSALGWPVLGLASSPEAGRRQREMSAAQLGRWHSAVGGAGLPSTDTSVPPGHHLTEVVHLPAITTSSHHATHADIGSAGLSTCITIEP